MADYPAEIRDARDSDRGYVVAHWLSSLYAGTRQGRPRGEWKREERARVHGHIEAGVCVVACDPLDADRLYGFACGAPGVLHYVFVSQPRRDGGLARDLLGALRSRVGEWTRESYRTKGWR